jgi:hypothetical protein
MMRTKEHTVIPNVQFVIPDVQFVIPDLIRDPVPRHHWIAGQARNDKETLSSRTPDRSPGQARSGIQCQATTGLRIVARNDKAGRNDKAASVLLGRCHEFRKHQ